MKRHSTTRCTASENWIIRRCSLAILASFVFLGAVANPHFVFAKQKDVEPELNWTPAAELSIEGRGFKDTLRFFDRLPTAAENIVRKQVWDLSRHSSGIMIRFRTNAESIHVKYDLFNELLAMPHMPATGVSGLDLYAEDDNGKMRWAAVFKSTSRKNAGRLIHNVSPLENGKTRIFQLYLPLYNGVDRLEIGVPKSAVIEPAATRDQKPIVFYGTSIMHGACASRPGMSISSILGRRLDRPVINLGFSGNGRMEKEVGQFICQLDPAVFVIDCLPNLGPKQVAERCPLLIAQIRKTHPKTPILLVEDRVFTNAWILQGKKQFHESNQLSLRQAYEKAVADGIENLFYLEGDHLLGDDHEAATDGSHPNDLGMVRYADVYEPMLRMILN